MGNGRGNGKVGKKGENESRGSGKKWQKGGREGVVPHPKQKSGCAAVNATSTRQEQAKEQRVVGGH